MKILSITKYLTIITLALGLAVGCAMTGSGEKASAKATPAAKAAIAAATAENKKAKKAGFEWRDTGKLLKKATAAALAGDNGKAIKLANKAKSEAMMAQKQAAKEKSMDRSLK